MATVDTPAPSTSITAKLTESHTQLNYELRRLSRVATFVAILSSPSVYYLFHHHNGWAVGKSLVMTFITVAAFRGLCDILVRKVIPWPSLFGTDDKKLREDDIMNRRRAWTWRWFFRLSFKIVVLITIVYLIQVRSDPSVTWTGVVPQAWEALTSVVHNPLFIIYALQLPFLFFANFIIFLGPMLLMGVTQMKVFQPGDADWGVKLDDVRGQAEAKEEIRRIIVLWQSGEVFEGAGGKRERGLIFHGAPGTGKTMMAKAIATGFNSPFITMPGSGFAQTFIGIDAIIVRVLAWRAKKQAKKWGGQCIVFIDEIDAVGMRRQSLGFEPEPVQGGAWGGRYGGDFSTASFYGPYGALNQSGDLIGESQAWREWMFRQRAPEPRSHYPGWYRKLANTVNQGAFPGMGGMGQLALNQLLVTMDGVDNPPFMKNFWTNRANSFFDAIYIVPRRVRKPFAFVIAVGLQAVGAFFFLNSFLDEVTGSPLYAPLTAELRVWNIIIMAIGIVILVTGTSLWSAASGKKKRKIEAKKWFKPKKAKEDDYNAVSLRLPRVKPTGHQIYFIGATNVPLSRLDPALIRPGRMGRHVWFRTPTKDDRKDIFDLYLEKVAHDPTLDTPERRDEIARITNGYSPAMIDQICSMALTNAHHEGRAYFVWTDLVEAMTVIESGSAINIEYHDDDSRSVAIHEAGHATAAHVYRTDLESSRLSIRMRGGSLGHHQFFEKEEKFSTMQSTVMGDLIHVVGAMAAEFVFFGENSTGVGGDLGTASGLAAWVVGAAGMSPLPIDLKGKTFEGETEDQSRERVIRRFEDVGNRLMNTGSIPEMRKRAYAAQFIGQAFVTAYNLIVVNRDKVQAVADAVYEQKEIYGDDLVRLLDRQNFIKPDIDWTDDANWPNIMNYTKLRRDEDKERREMRFDDERDGDFEEML